MPTGMIIEVFYRHECAAGGAPWSWPGDPVYVHEFELVNMYS